MSSDLDKALDAQLAEKSFTAPPKFVDTQVQEIINERWDKELEEANPVVNVPSFLIGTSDVQLKSRKRERDEDDYPIIVPLPPNSHVFARPSTENSMASSVFVESNENTTTVLPEEKMTWRDVMDEERIQRHADWPAMQRELSRLNVATRRAGDSNRKVLLLIGIDQMYTVVHKDLTHELKMRKIGYIYDVETGKIGERIRVIELQRKVVSRPIVEELKNHPILVGQFGYLTQSAFEQKTNYWNWNPVKTTRANGTVGSIGCILGNEKRSLLQVIHPRDVIEALIDRESTCIKLYITCLQSVPEDHKAGWRCLQMDFGGDRVIRCRQQYNEKGEVKTYDTNTRELATNCLAHNPKSPAMFVTTGWTMAKSGDHALASGWTSTKCVVFLKSFFSEIEIKVFIDWFKKVEKDPQFAQKMSDAGNRNDTSGMQSSVLTQSLYGFGKSKIEN